MKPVKNVIYPDYQFKIIIIGSYNVGKTSLLLRFVEDAPLMDYTPTIGVDFRTKCISFKNKTLKLKIWDTAGQERFRWITSSYYKQSQGALALYDITDKESFKRVESLIQYYKDESEADNPMNIVLVGNKSDLHKEREVSQKEAEELSK